MSSTTNGSISKKTFECFVCQKQGFPNERVYLAGKDENGKTIYISEDGITRHQHKFKESRYNSLPKQAQNDTTKDEIIQLLKDIDSKLNRLLVIEGQ